MKPYNSQGTLVKPYWLRYAGEGGTKDKHFRTRISLFFFVLFNSEARAALMADRIQIITVEQ